MIKDNDIYMETHHNWFIVIFVGIIFTVVGTIATIQDAMSLKESIIVASVMLSIFGFVTLLTFKQNTIADKYGISIIMGIGLFKYSITYESIKEVSIIKLRGSNLIHFDFHPYGISPFNFHGRWNRRNHCMIYNIGMTRRGILINQPGGRSAYHLIGTSHPEELAEFIKKRLPQK